METIQRIINAELIKWDSKNIIYSSKEDMITDFAMDLIKHFHNDK